MTARANPDAGSGAELSRAEPSALLALYSASAAQASLSFVVLGLPAIGPELQRQFQLTLPELGIVLTIALVGSGVTFLPVARGIARFGSRRTAFAGTAVATAALSAAAFSSSSGVLIALLFVAGAGMAVIPIVGGASVLDSFPPGRRAWAMGIRQMSAPLGAMVAAVAMPALVAVGGVELALLAGAALVGATGIILGVCSTSTVNRIRPSTPIRVIWRAPGFRSLLLMACLYVAVLQAVLSYTVPSVRDFGFSAFVAGAAYFVVNVTSMFSRVAFGRRADRDRGTRRRRTLVETGLVAAVGAVLFMVVLHTGLAVLVPVGVVVLALGASGWNAIAYTLSGELTCPDLATLAFALSSMVVFIATGVCAPLLGVVAANAGWNAVWLVTAGLALCGTAVALTLPRTAPPA